MSRSEWVKVLPYKYELAKLNIAYVEGGWMHTASEPLPVTGGKEVTAQVIKDLEARKEQGIEKYGTPLQTHNGRRPLVDLYQELLDAVQYLKQHLMEQEGRAAAVAIRDMPGTAPHQWSPSPCAIAHDLVNGDRGDAYGHPIFDMTKTADQWTGIFRSLLRPGVRFEAEDVAQAMIAVKQSRERNQPKFDNIADIAGYAETIGKMRAWRAEHPGIDPRTVM